MRQTDGKDPQDGTTGKPPGIKDVARAAGVSAATVSQVLNDVPGSRISVETRQRIQRAAAELGYVPNRLARGMRTGRSGMLGLISDHIATSPFAGSIVVGAQDAALKHGRTLVLVNTNGDPAVEQDSVTALLRHQVDGFLYATMFHRSVSLPAALEQVPTVLLDAASDRADLPSVVPDEVGGAEVAVGELLAHGHRRIGFLTNEDDVPATHGRLEGYRSSLARAGIDVDPRLILEDESVTAGGYRTARELLAREDRPTGLFCYNDRMAMGAYRAAAEAGLRIPEDLSVVGFDNQLLLAEDLHPAMTTVALPHYEMGAWAVEALVALLEGRPVSDDDVTFPVALACPLVRRASVAAPSRPLTVAPRTRDTTVLRLPASWTWDFWLAKDQDTYHLFFLKASRALRDPDRRHWRATVGHAVSDDLRTWTEVADALVPSDAPAIGRPRHLDRLGGPRRQRPVVDVLHRRRPGRPWAGPAGPAPPPRPT